MERTLFGFIIRYSKREQWLIVPFVVASMVVYFLSLDLPKTIINQAIQGQSFPDPDSVAAFLRLQFTLPKVLGGATLTPFSGFELERLPYLFALCVAFLTLIVVNGLLKLRINTMKGWLGERMLRRLRYQLFDHILRFPLPRFRRIKSAEMATMIKDEIEPLGGFIGDSIITPLFLGGQALTALFFIVYQHLALGMVALIIVTVQTAIIPKMRRKLLVLAKQRQLGARQLAGRIAECVDGVAEIHAHGTSNYARAEISDRLGRLFRIRFEFYQRKFFIKFLNNFLAQVTPFIFYSIGGYLVIVGRLDIGALVAVIAAYKDLPSPVKELIDWDQRRLDVSIKYNQVIEQFTVEDVMPPAVQELLERADVPREGRLRASNLTLIDESGTKAVDGVSFEVGLHEHVGVVGGPSSGSSELAQLVARLLFPTSGSLEIGDVDMTRAPEAITGRTFAYVGTPAYLFPVSVRDNLLYGLKSRPLRERVYEGEALAERRFNVNEAERTGTPLFDINAEWIDYEAAGVTGPDEMEARILEVLHAVDLDEAIFELGLRSAVDASHGEELRAHMLGAREAMHERLESLGIQDWVERFDPAHYNRNATLAENLLFGTPVGRTFDIDNLAANAYVRRVLQETGLTDDLLRIGHKVAETMVELFSGLPPGHEFFERFSFIRHEDLPQYKAMLARILESGLKGITEEDRGQLLGLPFKLSPARHRLGLIDDALQARVLEARRYFAQHLPESQKTAVEFFDPTRYNAAASLQDNILFGKIVTGQAEAATRIGALLRQVLDELGLRPLVTGIGLDYQVGTGGARLAAADRQKAALARALLKRPAMLVLDHAAAMLDPATQSRVMGRILEYRKGQGIFWALSRAEFADRFEQVLVLDRGKLAERGAFESLKGGGGALHKLLNPA
jgi:putative ABC transport system ATP-binding protein